MVFRWVYPLDFLGLSARVSQPICIAACVFQVTGLVSCGLLLIVLLAIGPLFEPLPNVSTSVSALLPFFVSSELHFI